MGVVATVAEGGAGVAAVVVCAGVPEDAGGAGGGVEGCAPPEGDGAGGVR